MIQNLTRIVLFIVFHYMANLAYGGNELYVEFTSPEANQYFIKLLKERFIPHRVDGEGRVWYSIDDQFRVRKVEKIVLKEHHPGNSISFPDNKYSKILQRKLSEEALKFRVIVNNGKEEVAWDKEDETKVRKLINEVSEIVTKDTLRMWEEK